MYIAFCSVRRCSALAAPDSCHLRFGLWKHQRHGISLARRKVIAFAWFDRFNLFIDLVSQIHTCVSLPGNVKSWFPERATVSNVAQFWDVGMVRRTQLVVSLTWTPSPSFEVKGVCLRNGGGGRAALSRISLVVAIYPRLALLVY